MVQIRHLRNTIGLFIIVGVGLGLSGYITLDFLQSTFVEGTEEGFARNILQLIVAMVGIQTGFVTFLLGSVVACTTGLGSASAYASSRSAAISNGVSSAIGFVPMVAVAVGIMALAFGGGGGEAATGGTTTPTPTGGTSGGESPFEWGEVIKNTLILCVPTGLVGAGAGFIGFGFEE